MARDLQTVQATLAQIWSASAFADLDAADQTQINLRINLAKDYIAGWPKQFDRGWLFSRTTAYLATTAKHTTGNIDFTQYSTAIVKGTVSPAFTTAMEGSLIIAASGAFPYRIKTVTDADNAILYTPYQASTVSASSYTIVKDVYSLPSDFSYMARNSVKPDGKDILTYISSADIDERYPKSTTINTPNYYCDDDVIASGTSAGVKQIRFIDGYPDVALGIQYKYYRILPDLTQATDISAISYAQGGDSAFLFSCIWQLKQIATENTANDVVLAKQEADEAIALMWANAQYQSEDSKKFTAGADQRITDLSNW